MGWLGRRKRYDRSRILARAARARKNRRPKKALALYQQVLEREPRDAEIQRKVAALLAETKQYSEAWTGYRRAVEGIVRRGFLDRAIGTLREASRYLPREIEVWQSLADLELKRDRPVDAHRALLEGRKNFRSTRHRREALLLLIRARKLAPTDFETNYDLAGLFARSGAPARAQSLLEGLVPRSTGRRLRRVRSRQFGISPSPASAWRWLRAVFGRR
jgi:tetratricopeptide (TPR) repeat protein